MKVSNWLKLVSQIKTSYAPVIDADADYPCHKYEAKINGEEITLFHYPKSNGVLFPSGWSLKSDWETLAARDGREPVEVYISDDRARFLFEGVESFEKEREDLEAQIAALSERLERVKNLQYYGFVSSRSFSKK